MICGFVELNDRRLNPSAFKYRFSNECPFVKQFVRTNLSGIEPQTVKSVGFQVPIHENIFFKCTRKCYSIDSRKIKDHKMSKIDGAMWDFATN